MVGIELLKKFVKSNGPPTKDIFSADVATAGIHKIEAESVDPLIFKLSISEFKPPSAVDITSS